MTLELPLTLPPAFSLDAATTWLGQKLQRERLLHSMGTSDKAAELAEKFRLSPTQIQRCRIAGLLHDNAKLLSPQALLDFCDAHGLPLHAADRQTPQTLHPLVGAEVARQELGVEDATVLDAIRYHTTGRAVMDTVEKIVYVADKIEGNTRNPLFVKKTVQHLNFADLKSLDVTVLYLLESTMSFLITKQQIIHPRTLEARNDLLQRLAVVAAS